MTHIPESTPLDTAMLEANEAYALGYVDTASFLYHTAYELSLGVEDPNWITTTQAARGALESNHRQGIRGVGIEHWRGATSGALENAVDEVAATHGWTTRELLEQPSIPAEARPAVREIIQTGTVLGKLILRGAMERESGNRLGRAMAGSGAEHDILHHLRRSGGLLHLVETEGVIDQYRINWQTPAAFGERLYGSRWEAAKIAFGALGCAGGSEDPELPTANKGLSEEARAASVNRARKRAKASVASLVLPRSEALVLGLRAV